MSQRAQPAAPTEPAASPVGGSGWLRQRLLPGGSGALMIAAYASILTALISFILGQRDLPAPLYYTTILLLSGMFVLHMFWPDLTIRLGHRRAAWTHLSLNGAIFLAASYVGFGGSFFSFLPFLIFMLCAEAVVDLPRRSALAYCAALFGGWLATMALRDFSPEAMLGNGISVGLGLIFSTLFAGVLKQAQDERARAEGLLSELRAANAALEAARGRERELAAAEERVRLARDIHDGLGHHLTVLNVQLQAAAKLVERDPERAANAIALCREEAQAALEEVRQSVAVMRRSPLDGRSLPEAIAALVHDFGRASPLRANFALHGEARQLDPIAAMTLYRAAQEGLTNAQKHAAATTVEVALEFRPSQARLRVADNGSGAGGSAAGVSGGFGLAGLRERAERLGGRLSAGPAPEGGFRLEIELPV